MIVLNYLISCYVCDTRIEHESSCDCRASARLGLFEEGLDGGFEAGGGLEGSISVDDVTVLINQELLKVPLDSSEAQQTSLLLLQVDVDGVGVVAVDVDLLKNGESDAVVQLTEGGDLVSGTRLLATKLVAGEADDGESLILVLLVDLLKALVLGSKATLGGDVHDEHDLALKLLEGERLSVLVEWSEVVESGIGFLGGHCVCCSKSIERKTGVSEVELKSTDGSLYRCGWRYCVKGPPRNRLHNCKHCIGRERAG
jgi:hypothetical protein